MLYYHGRLHHRFPTLLIVGELVSECLYILDQQLFLMNSWFIRKRLSYVSPLSGQHCAGAHSAFPLFDPAWPWCAALRSAPRLTLLHPSPPMGQSLTPPGL